MFELRSGRRRNRARSRKIERALKRHFEQMSSPDCRRDLVGSDVSSSDDDDDDDDDDNETDDQESSLDDNNDDDITEVFDAKVSLVVGVWSFVNATKFGNWV